jgi:uncharacterized membrane protein YdbT with pleckstrin-like domain
MSEEQTLFKGSTSPVIILGTIVLCGIILAACFVFAFLVSAPYSYILMGIGLVDLAYLIVRWLLIKVRVYEVTTERIRVTTGALTKRTDELELYRVKDVTLVEPLMARLLSLGTIEIATNDVSTPIVRLEVIKGARALREELRKSIEACREKRRVRLAELE